jgi:hypothetical protein
MHTDVKLARKEMIARGRVFMKATKASQTKPISLLLAMAPPDIVMLLQI